MKLTTSSTYFTTLLFVLLILAYMMVEAQAYEAIREINKKKPPRGRCNQNHGADCCRPGTSRSTCSPPVYKHNTKAILTLNSFQKGGDGGGPSECDGRYHNDNTLVVALSTGWYNNGKRCHKFIKINGNGKSVKAMVVDECDSSAGCQNNIVDGSKAVWKALGVKPNDDKWGWMDVTWSDA